MLPLVTRVHVIAYIELGKKTWMLYATPPVFIYTSFYFFYIYEAVVSNKTQRVEKLLFLTYVMVFSAYGPRYLLLLAK